MKKYLTLLFACGLPFCHAETIYVAIASNFAKPAQEIARQFEKKTGVTVSISAAGTGVLANQIKNNAPYQVFLSADATTTKMLAQANLAVESSEFTYARGQLVLLNANGALINPAQVLTAMKYQRIALANPKLAPYGVAAYAVLKHYKLLPAVESKIVEGDNINATYQYVASKNADLGFVALSQVILDKDIKTTSYWRIPAAITPLIEQNAILLTKGQSNKSAREFLNYLQSSAAKLVIAKYGYQ